MTRHCIPLGSESSSRGFWLYVVERYRTMQRRALGLPAPWSEDPILQRYRFCNVFREDDFTTAWFRENLRAPYSEGDLALRACYLFRWFNRVGTGVVLAENDLVECWTPERARTALGQVSPLVTGAYIIKTPAGMSKLEGIIWCIERYLEREQEILSFIREDGTLQGAWKALRELPFMGPFMAYEVVTDLRHTALLRHAPDISKWASAGPGAVRGAARVLYNSPLALRYGHLSDRDEVDMLMAMLLEQSREEWPRSWPAWEMRDVEHNLCEYDKYERARLGEGRPRQRFRSGQCT